MHPQGCIFCFPAPAHTYLYLHIIGNYLYLCKRKQERNMNGKNCTEQLSPVLLWDIAPKEADIDTCPQRIIAHVLEHGMLEVWHLIRTFYGLEKIVECCKQVRSLDPVALSFICCISHTRKEEYRCYHTAQEMITSL